MDNKAIDEIVGFLRKSLIENGVKVDSIALFGSASRGENNKDSDIDLVIISSDFKELDLFERANLTIRSERETIKKFKVPIDIINMSPHEYDESNLKLLYQPKTVA